MGKVLFPCLLLLACSLFATSVRGECDFPFSGSGNCAESRDEFLWTLALNEDSDYPASLITYLAVSADDEYHFFWELGDHYYLDKDTDGDNYDISIDLLDEDEFGGANKVSSLLAFLVCALCLSLGVSTGNKRSNMLILAFLVILPLASLQESETLTLSIHVPESVLRSSFSITFTPSSSITVSKNAAIAAYLSRKNCVVTGDNDCSEESTDGSIPPGDCPPGQYKSAGVCTTCQGGSTYSCSAGFIRTGTVCSGAGTTDTQTCAACNHGGAAYSCAASGEYRNGTLCSGLTTVDSQTCGPCTGGSTYTCATYQYKSGAACDSNSTSDTQTCTNCTGGANYTCPVGSRVDGVMCDGTTNQDTQLCAVCLNSNVNNTLPYSCGAGSYKTGSDCTGTVTTDTQSCATCTGGANYSCPTGQSPSGTACDGLGTSDTQTCTIDGCNGNPALCSATQHCANNICVNSGWLFFSASWDLPGDGDLYVTTPGGFTIEYTNRGPDNGTDYGSLDRDDTTGTGPENVYWPITGPYPPAGVYHACLDNYSTTFTIPQNITYFLNSTTAMTKVAANTHTTPGLPNPCNNTHPNYLGNVTVVGLNCSMIVGAGCSVCNPTRCFSCAVGYELNATFGCTALPPCGAGYCTSEQRCVAGACIGTGVFYFSIQWQMPGDVDIYLTTPNGNTISYTNLGPDTATDFGFLDRDDKVGTGPENIYWQAQYASPPAGTYSLCVDNFDASAVIGQNIYYQLNSATNLTHVLQDTHGTPGLPDPCTPAHPNFLGNITYAGLNCSALFGAGCNTCNAVKCFGCGTGFGLDNFNNVCVALTPCVGVFTGDTGVSIADDFCDPYYRCLNAACIGSGYLFFTIQWSSPGDGDIYLTTPLGNTIYYGQQTADGGFQDRDDTSGTGPENIYWPRYNRAPPAGTYNLCIDNYNTAFVIPQTVYWQAGEGSAVNITNHTYQFTVDSHSTPGAPDPCTMAHPNWLGSVTYGGFDCNILGITGCSACNDTMCFECEPGYNYENETCVDICSLCSRNERCVNNVCIGAGVLYFTIQWQFAGDLDIVLTTPAGNTIYYGNLMADGGSLDRDDTTGTGPENIFWDTQPAAGTYFLCAYNQGSLPLPNTVSYNLNSPTVRTKALVDAVGVSASTACSAAHPNYLGSVVV